MHEGRELNFTCCQREMWTKCFCERSRETVWLCIFAACLSPTAVIAVIKVCYTIQWWWIVLCSCLPKHWNDHKLNFIAACICVCVQLRLNACIMAQTVFIHTILIYGLYDLWQASGEASKKPVWQGWRINARVGHPVPPAGWSQTQAGGLWGKSYTLKNIMIIKRQYQY